MNPRPNDYLFRATNWGLFRHQGEIDFSDLGICKRFISWFNHSEIEYIFVDLSQYKGCAGKMDLDYTYDEDDYIITKICNIKIHVTTKNKFIQPLPILAHEISHYVLHKTVLIHNKLWYKHNEDGVNALASHLIDEFIANST